MLSGIPELSDEENATEFYTHKSGDKNKLKSKL